jgi:hypothetical protein
MAFGGDYTKQPTMTTSDSLICLLWIKIFIKKSCYQERQKLTYGIAFVRFFNEDNFDFVTGDFLNSCKLKK